MFECGKTEGRSVKHLINIYDWSSLPHRSTVVDVGGIGQASRALLESFSHSRFIVQDLPRNAVMAERESPRRNIWTESGFGSHLFERQPDINADVRHDHASWRTARSM